MGRHSQPSKADRKTDQELSKAALEAHRQGGNARDIAKILGKASAAHQAEIIKRIRG
jgi:hypothetical protein